MPNNRRTTVYELAALRLHPDGVRAGEGLTRQAHHVRDARGNILAADAARTVNVLKRPRLRQKMDAHNDVDEEDFANNEDNNHIQEKPRAKRARLRRRDAFEDTKLNFLSEATSGPVKGSTLDILPRSIHSH